jgi:hypothetical protein
MQYMRQILPLHRQDLTSVMDNDDNERDFQDKYPRLVKYAAKEKILSHSKKCS